MKPYKRPLKAIGIVFLAVVLGSAASAFAYEKSVHNGNGVRVTVKPTAVASDKAVKFDVRFNTHSVELDQDLIAVSELRDDKGRSYRPDQWKGSPPGGHHRKGTLIFPVLKGSVKSVTLIIRDVADIPERVFTWNVKPEASRYQG